LTRIGREALVVTHPGDADLGFLYGTIITDGAPADQPSRNLCIFAEGQIDRSPTGSGVTARMALDLAKGLVAPGQRRRFVSVTGGEFTGEVVAQGADGAIIEVGGRSHLMGRGVFIIEADDEQRFGFDLPKRFPAIAPG
jgi:trans-L-3-hydroxyproline dehydratase